VKRWSLPQVLRDERGSVMVVVALAMTALLSMVALAVDVGMLFTARGEAQRVADAAALAGAASFIEAPTDAERPRDLAIEYAGRNDVRRVSVMLEPGDVEVDLANYQVTVTVPRTAARGAAVTTWFARVFGIDAVDVIASATAEAAPAGGAICMKPFTIPDAWNDVDKDGRYDDGEPYDAGVTGYGTDFRNGVPSDNGIDPKGTTYDFDFGRPIALKEGTPDQSIVPSWYFPWDVPEASGAPSTGADRYRWNIANCNPSVVSVGEAHWVENGNMPGPTSQGMRELIALDPDAEFDVVADSVVGSRYQPWKASPRVGNIPLFDPQWPVRPGKKPVVFNNITAFWIEGMNGNDVIGRFLYASGVAPGGPGTGTTTGPQVKYVRLIR
jgi:hypothetical protein